MRPLAFCLACCCGLPALGAAVDSLRPQWLQQRPESPGFLIGIGAAAAAQRSASAQTAYNRALARALNDIASQLQVEVTSQATLRVSESRTGVREDFAGETHLRTVADLDGVEIVASWVGGDTTWVYTRLDADAFEQRQRARLTGLCDRLDRLVQEVSDARPALALAAGMNALELLSTSRSTGRFAEHTEVDRWKVDLLAALRQRLSGLRLLAGTGVDADSGTELSVSAQTSCPDGVDTPCAGGLPVRWSFVTGAGEVTALSWTDGSGRASASISHVGASRRPPAIAAAIDLTAFAARATGTWQRVVADLPVPATRIVLRRPRLTAQLLCEVNAAGRIDVARASRAASPICSPASPSMSSSKRTPICACICASACKRSSTWAESVSLSSTSTSASEPARRPCSGRAPAVSRAREQTRKRR